MSAGRLGAFPFSISSFGPLASARCGRPVDGCVLDVKWNLNPQGEMTMLFNSKRRSSRRSAKGQAKINLAVFESLETRTMLSTTVSGYSTLITDVSDRRTSGQPRYSDSRRRQCHHRHRHIRQPVLRRHGIRPHQLHRLSRRQRRTYLRCDPRLPPPPAAPWPLIPLIISSSPTPPTPATAPPSTRDARQPGIVHHHRPQHQHQQHLPHASQLAGRNHRSEYLHGIDQRRRNASTTPLR